MAFDFLGTLSKNMWTAFSTFISNSLYTNVVNPIPTSFSYDINTHTVTQKHLPNSSDHQTATAPFA